MNNQRRPHTGTIEYEEIYLHAYNIANGGRSRHRQLLVVLDARKPLRNGHHPRDTR
jgi:hypothetical protein